MNSKIKKTAGYIYLLVTIVILVFIGILSKDLKNAGETMLTLKKLWVLAAFFSMIAFIFLEGYILHYFFKQKNIKNNFWSTLKTALIGLYYSCLTPSSSGGQPAQVLYFNKQGISVGASTSALSVKLICFQITTVTSSLISFILCYNYVISYLHKAVPFIILGLMINLIPVVLIIILAVRKSILERIFAVIIKFLYKIHIVKDVEALIEKGNTAIGEYCSQLSFIKANPKILFAVLIMTVIQVLTLMTISYFVYASFGIQKYSFGLILCLQFMLYSSVSFTPLPGASGAQEVGFFIFFKAIFSDHKLYLALLIWRFFTYYMTIILGAVIIIIDSGLNIIMKKKKT